MMLHLLVVAAVAVLFMAGRGFLAALLGTGWPLWLWLTSAGGPSVAAVLVALVWLAWVAVFGVPAWRRQLVTPRVMRILGPILPTVSDTERAALEAGTVWWDGELFSGRPDWSRLLDFEVKGLSQREQAFLDGPVEELCAMLDDHQVFQDGDLPEQAWAFIKEQGFFGMIIPESHGGLGFGARAHSAVVTKLASRSVAAAVTVMVPNSLGPAELLLHYGTDAQREHWLPRLAQGEEIPCFALTGPENGSDAAAMEARGVVCRGEWDGEEVLGLRLHWDKRYTTLGPVATVIGLAFKLYDPDGLLGGTEDRGITCALVPTHLDGITIGQRHDPLGVPFHNGPNSGEDVFVPLDECVIGGREMVGEGWRMLMDCLAAGRSISLPSLSVGATQMATRFTGAYASVRKQFNLPVGRFEGVAEVLARIAGTNYALDGVRTLTAGAVDAGEKPSVLSAIAKAWCTEGMRDANRDAMDVVGGAGISRGPRNVLARAHQAVPIGITVEGANILTRSMIIFGQGAIRCHPFVQDEMRSVEDGDLGRFDGAFFGHINFVVCNMARGFLRALLPLPAGGAGRTAATRRALRRLSRQSAAFATMADFAMGTLGGDLKRKESITGRFADALAWLYLGSAAVKRFVDEGERPEDRAILEWCVATATMHVERAHFGVLDNLPLRPVAWLRPLLYPLGPRNRGPSDALGLAVAAGFVEGGEQRTRHTADIYVPPADEPGLGSLEATLARVLATEEAGRTLHRSLRSGALRPGRTTKSTIHRAREAGVLEPEDADALMSAECARHEEIQVDAFDPDDYRALK